MAIRNFIICVKPRRIEWPGLGECVREMGNLYEILFEKLEKRFGIKEYMGCSYCGRALQETGFEGVNCIYVTRH
jgi:hypothetical protein